MRKMLLGIAAITVFLATAAVAIAQITGGVPSANPRSGTPSDILATGFTKSLLAQGSDALENPSGIITNYGYLNDAAGQTSGLQTKTEPDENTYLHTTSNPGGPTAGYNYGRHFLIQGHELFSSAVAGVGHSNSAYFTRVNLDVPVGNSHRITLLNAADASGNTGAASIDGSVYDPFTGKLVFTGEGNNTFGGVFSTNLNWSGTTMPSTDHYLGSFGTAGYEGITFDRLGNSYLVEDAGGINVTDGATATKVKQPNSFLFRFKPTTPGGLTSGKLQVLQVANSAGTPITFHTTGTGPRDDALGADILKLHSGAWLKVKWVTVHDTAVDGTATFNANSLAKTKGGTPFKRPENGKWMPRRGFRDFVFTETGDTSQEAQTYPGAAARGAYGALMHLQFGRPGADTGRISAAAVGDAVHNSFDNLSFFDRNTVFVGEDRGDLLHQQLNALDSLWSFDLTKSYSAINADAQRVIAQGRDADSFADVSKKEGVPPIADQNDGDNEVTGILVDPGWASVHLMTGVRDPAFKHDYGQKSGTRIFVTYQHGSNTTYELKP
ncbi:MAG: hypothetical protein ACRDKI_07460 [Solirubrobacterales bacterium]